MFRMITVALIFLLAHGTFLTSDSTWPTPEKLAQSLQQRYQQISDFSADFVHIYQGGVFRQQVTERGTMAIKKPGMMKWTYTKPERKLFISNGRKLYSYLLEDKQVIISGAPSNNQTTPATFLAGKGNLAKDFTASYSQDLPTPETYKLRLVPSKSGPEYKYLTIVIDRVTLQIRGLSTTDYQGGQSIFSFSNLKENQGLSEQDFEFTIPRGVDVINDDRELQ